ncbi:uncharacterized protein LOC129309966 isoform X2 [Prosopis cineraria]|uniref:uncharacterized protein LOC129309966 isoform X2 n=1 Tax=Prosopis cineraria TaxID=364024 RepID=UPI0024109446|nr:uncharacterized protein LOC129309966 isoform X2 [Prosopis cineraria]
MLKGSDLESTTFQFELSRKQFRLSRHFRGKLERRRYLSRSEMVQVCFILDLRSLAPPLLRDLKQSLLQLANLYAVSNYSTSSSPKSNSPADKIGLCYVFKNRFSSSDELKIAYSPRGNFNLRDFHHAVNSLPSDAFLPDNDNHHGKDIERKAIVVTSFLPEDVDSTMQKCLMDAAERCVSVDFAVFQQKSSHLTDTRENINNFRRCVSHLDNCSFQTYIPDFRVMHCLVKRWLQVLQDDTEETFQARLVFKENLLDSVNHIFCNLYAAAIPISNGFSQCQTCRCHGILLGDAGAAKFNRFSCPVTGSNLEACDVVENSVRVGDNTVLFLPSFHSFLKLPQINSRIDITVIRRTSLTSVNEGLIMGASFVVIPTPCLGIESTSDDVDQSDLNALVFRGLSSVLHSMDQGLICTSNSDLETLTEVPFRCYYILQPSDNGPMLLRRLAGAEEVLRVPDNRLVNSSVSKEIENSVEACLLKIDLTHYDPLLHERGFHQKLNFLVRESLQFGSTFPKEGDAAAEPSSSEKPSLEVTEKPETIIDVNGKSSELDLTTQEDNTIACITKEWEQLVVKEVPKIYSPSCMSKSKLDQKCVTPRDCNRQLDRETSRILERLEVPRPLKAKSVSPVSNATMTNASVPTKKPLIPFQPIQATEPVSIGSQLMKPNFQRLKRKHK